MCLNGIADLVKCADCPFTADIHKCRTEAGKVRLVCKDNDRQTVLGDGFVNCQYAFIDINLIITSKSSSLYKAVIPDDSFSEPARELIGPNNMPFYSADGFLRAQFFQFIEYGIKPGGAFVTFIASFPYL